MNNKATIPSLGLVAGLVAGSALPALAGFTQTWSGSQTVPDNNASGAAWGFSLNDLSQTAITAVRVDLDIGGGWNGDLYAYLSHSSGFAVLLNRVGRTGVNPDGYGDAGFKVRLADSFSLDIHNYGGAGGGVIAGDFAPDGRNVNPSSALDTDPRTALLGNLLGLNPNGNWTLFIADLAAGSTSTVRGWTVAVDTVPEPGTLALGMVALLGAAGCALRRLRQGPK